MWNHTRQYPSETINKTCLKSPHFSPFIPLTCIQLKDTEEQKLFTVVALVCKIKDIAVQLLLMHSIMHTKKCPPVFLRLFFCSGPKINLLHRSIFFSEEERMTIIMIIFNKSNIKNVLKIAPQYTDIYLAFIKISISYFIKNFGGI